MKNYVIIDDTAYLIKKVSKTDKAFECTWNYETGIMTVADEPSEVTIPSEKYNYEEMYRKLNVQYYIDYYANTQLQTNVTVTPTTSSQTIEPSSGYDGLADVTVEAVTAAIDENIVAGNIKDGVTILGVAGTYVKPEDANLVPENIKKGVTIYGVVGTYEGEAPSNQEQ